MRSDGHTLDWSATHCYCRLQSVSTDTQEVGVAGVRFPRSVPLVFENLLTVSPIPFELRDNMTTYTDSRFDDRSTTPLRVFKRDGTAIPFATPFADLAEVRGVLLAHPQAKDPKAFAHSLIRAIERIEGPSDKQAAWAHKVAVDMITPKRNEAQRSAALPDEALRPVLAMLQRAAEAQKRLPLIKLTATDDAGAAQPVVIKLRKAGGATVTDGRPYGDNTLFGFISDSGDYRPTRANSAEVESILCELAADPSKVAGQHGVATGDCCFCRRALTDKRSRSVGYGPVCADRFGVPYGDTSVADAADAAAKEAL